MPIGAAIGGAVVAGGATLGAGAMASSAQKKAASQASDTSLQVSRENNALFRETRDQNLGVLMPYAQAGYGATTMLSQLLGIPTSGMPTSSSGVPITGGSGGTGGGTSGGALSSYDRNAYLRGNTANPNNPLQSRFRAQSTSGDLVQPYGTTMPLVDTAAAPVLTGTGPDGRITAGDRIAYNRALRQYNNGGSGGNVTTGGGGTGGSGGNAALDAFAKFRQGTNYQWRLNEGMRALTGQWATRGALDSGAAEKAKITFGQNFASNELANYMDLLARQQAVGLSGASAIAGVGNSYAGNVAASNTAAGNAAANAALASGQANAGMWSSLGQFGGQLGGALFQYGMGQMRPATAPMSTAPINVYNANPHGFG